MRRGRKDPALEPSEGAQPGDTLFGLLASRTGREEMVVVVREQAWVAGSGSGRQQRPLQQTTSDAPLLSAPRVKDWLGVQAAYCCLVSSGGRAASVQEDAQRFCSALLE